MQPFIYYVLAFIGNARQLISTCQIIFSNKNFIFFFFGNFIFLKFVSFYLILFYFSKKNFFFFEIYCSQLTDQRLLFTDYCSWITVRGLLFTDYCSLITVGHNTKIVLQHNLPTALLHCNTIFQLPSLAIHSCILQYNFLSSPSSHNTILPAIQYSLPACNTILYCNST